LTTAFVAHHGLARIAAPCPDAAEVRDASRTPVQAWHQRRLRGSSPQRLIEIGLAHGVPQAPALIETSAAAKPNRRVLTTGRLMKTVLTPGWRHQLTSPWALSSTLAVFGSTWTGGSVRSDSNDAFRNQTFRQGATDQSDRQPLISRLR